MSIRRHTLLPALALALLLTGCKKNSTPNPANGSDSTGTDTLHLPPATNSKKGTDFNTSTPYGTYENNVIALKAFWYYTWGTPVPSPTPTNCEFVPMFWGPANMNVANIAAIQKAKASGQAKYVLGFNEPDHTDQANMTVSQALAFWPQLESIGLPLGSPATSWPTLQWFDDFMDSAIAQKKRVDFICVHMYVGTDDNSFVQTLQTVYSKYHLPIDRKSVV